MTLITSYLRHFSICVYYGHPGNFNSSSPLKYIEYGFGYVTIRSPHTPYSIYLRGTIILLYPNRALVKHLCGNPCGLGFRVKLGGRLALVRPLHRDYWHNIGYAAEYVGAVFLELNGSSPRWGGGGLE